MANVTYYVAMPFLQDETGLPVAGAAEECQHSSSALRRAEAMSRTPWAASARSLFPAAAIRWSANSAMRTCSGNSDRCRTI